MAGSSPELITADLPADEIIPVAGTVVVRDDP
jgi:hypothetical protein